MSQPTPPQIGKAALRHALTHDRTVDITTTGRRSGRKRRVEIWFHYIDERIYISGLPGRRDWYANLLARPDFTFHFKESTQLDLDASALPVTDPDERRRVLRQLLAGIGREGAIEEWVAHSPVIEVRFPKLQREREDR